MIPVYNFHLLIKTRFDFSLVLSNSLAKWSGFSLHRKCTLIYNVAKTEPQNMTASYQPTVVPNKDLGIWNEPAVKIVINSCLYNVITHFVIGDAKRKKVYPKIKLLYLFGQNGLCLS